MLDAAILVVSAVEGIQAQTRVLMRTLSRLGIPTLIFVNKIDRMGARSDDLVADLRTAWADGVVAMTRTCDVGTRSASVQELPIDHPEIIDVVTVQDERLLAEYVDRGTIDAAAAVVQQTARSLLHPVFFGSAITGAGIAQLAAGMRRFLAPKQATAGGQLHAQIFKIDRDDAGEKIAYIRMRSGCLTARDRIELHTTDGGCTAARPRAVEPFVRGTNTESRTARTGDIAKVWGLHRASIGDQLGRLDRARAVRLAKPGLESIVTPTHPEERIRLHAALEILAEQDPLINVHLDQDEIAVSLYGEVQGQVLQARLQRDFGVDADFAPARTVYVEKPVGHGVALERIGPGAIFDATVGLQVETGVVGSGIVYRDATQPGHMPLAFHRAIEETVTESLRQGMYGWQLTDCVVTLIDRGYSPPSSTGSDFRKLTPLVLAAALRRARTRVYEPLNAFEIDAPAGAARAILRLMTSVGAALETTQIRASRCEMTGQLPAAQVYRVSQRLPGLTQGDGAFLSRPSGHRKVAGKPPTRPRTDGNPYNRKEYLMYLANH